VSRKRKNKHAAVPEEILAEGSAGTPVHVQSDEAGAELHVTAEAEVEAEAVEMAEAAPELEAVVETPKKGRRRSRKAVEPEVGEASAEALDAASAHAEELEARVEGIDAPGEPIEAGDVGELAEIVAELADADGIAHAPEDSGEVGEPGEPQALTTDGLEGGELVADAAEGDEVAAVMPTSAASLDDSQLRHLVEALVFAADKPITVQRLRQLTRVADVRRLETALAELAVDYQDRGVILQQVSGGYQFRTQTKFSAWVQQLIQGRPVRLSRAQLETLAIVAYRQPITRPEIDDIRGVDSSATLKLLMDRALIRILGKREEVGRPMLYGTTKEFLDFFSLGDLRELPTLREYSELTDESRKVMKDRLGISSDGGGEPEGGAPPSDGGDVGAPPTEGGGEPASAAEAAADEDPIEAAAEAPPVEAVDQELTPEPVSDEVMMAEMMVEVAVAVAVDADVAAVAPDGVEGAPEPIYVVEADEGHWPQGSMRMAAVDPIVGLEPDPEPPMGDADAHAVPEVLEETGAAATREPTQE